MRNRTSSAAKPRSPASPTTPHPNFTPADRRSRQDGWTPERQHNFIRALAESACVTEACAAVGLSPSSAYRLRAMPAATAFRQAWDIALDYAVRRLADAAFSRALHGVSRPVFFKGEQIGERRYFDEKLTMFLLRTRDPVRYGRWLDGMEARRHPDGAGLVLAHALNAVVDAGYDAGDDDGDEDGGGEGGGGGGVGGDEDEAFETDEDPDASPVSMPPALDQGFPRAARPGEPGYHPHFADNNDDMPEEARALRQMLRERSLEIEENRKASFADDPVEDDSEADWQVPLTVHRPRCESKRRTRRQHSLPP